MTETRKVRFTRRRPCPGCGGGDDLPRGQGQRCSGWMNAGDPYFHCSREEFAGGLPQEAGGTYCHRLTGPCRCGQEHAPSPWVEGEPRSTKSPMVAEYPYCNESGQMHYVVERREPKDFRQKRPDGKGGWIWNLNGVQRVLYRLPELMAADPGEVVYIAEGEKDVDNLRRLGLVATCNSGGAGKWRDEYSEKLRGRHVVVLQDNDPDGKKHAQQVADSLAGRVASLRIVGFPDQPPKGDVTDWLGAGHTVDDLRALVLAAPEVGPPAKGKLLLPDSEHAQPALPPSSPSRSPSREPPWPTPHPAAFYGLPGDIVRRLDPETEADPVALLVRLLVVVGVIVGRNPFAVVEGTRHYLNEFALFIGRTAKARKDTARGRIDALARVIAPEWFAHRVVSGLASGEGLAHAVRDKVERDEPVKEKGKPTGEYTTTVTDPGEDDKRLFDNESEFSRVLRVTQRDGNTLSAILREAWDGNTLQSLVRNSPLRATDPHIGIVGNITVEELRRYLVESEVAGGTGNRFLMVLTRRSKVLPEGGQDIDMSDLLRRLADVIAWAQEKPRELRRDDAARAMWAKVYVRLTAEVPGLYGALTARAEAHVLRLSCLYAVLDKSDTVRVPHLRAALALWVYCASSVRHVFGNALGDPVADRILAALANTPGGLNRTELHELFGRNLAAARLDHALGVLLEHGRARCERIGGENGRSVELWRAVDLGYEVDEFGDFLMADPNLSLALAPESGAINSSNSSTSSSGEENADLLVETGVFEL